MITAGIDPGINGAIALLDGNFLVAVHDMPKMAAANGKNVVNAAALHKILTSAKIGLVILEQVGGRPGESAPWAFNFGRSFGNIEGVVLALQIPIRYVSPVKWKRAAGVPPKQKDYARTIAQRLFPFAELSRKKDLDRAEAILIGLYGSDK